MSFDEFALICTYSAISVLSQAKSGLSFFLVFLMQGLSTPIIGTADQNYNSREFVGKRKG
jgi:hypothetical protein